MVAYDVRVDWDDDGTAEVIPKERIRDGLTIRYGRDQQRSLAPLAPGTASFELKNTSRDYLPDNTSSPLYGKVLPGRSVEITATAIEAGLAEALGLPFTLPSTLTAEVPGLYTGFVDDLDVLPDINQRTVDITCADPFGRLKGVHVATGLHRGLRSGEALHKLLDAVNWPPEARDIDLGSSVFPLWWANGDAYDEAMKIVDSEGPTTLLTCDPSRRVVFRGRHHRLTRLRSKTAQATWSSSLEPKLSPPVGYDHGWRDIINRLTIDVPIRTSTGQLVEVWRNDGRFAISADQTVVFTATASDPFYDAVTPVAGTDYTLHAGSVTVTMSRTSGQQTTISIKALAGTAVLSDLRLRAKSLTTALTLTVDVTDSASVKKYGEKAWPDNRGPVWASLWDVQGIAQAILGQRGERLPTITAKFAGGLIPRMVQQLTRDLSDRVRITDSTSGVDFDFFVEQIQHTIGGLDHQTVFGCEKAPAQINNVFVLGSATNGVLGQNRLGRRGIDQADRVFVLGSPSNGVLGYSILAA